MNKLTINRPYPAHALSPLIHNPSGQSPALRSVFMGLTAVAWVLWVYLWSPLIVLPLRAFGFSGAAFADSLWMETPGVMLVLGIVAGAFLLTTGWVECRRRFFSRGRARQLPEARLGDVGNPDGLDAESARHLSLASRVLIQFNKIGTPVRVFVSSRKSGRLAPVSAEEWSAK